MKSHSYENFDSPHLGPRIFFLYDERSLKKAKKPTFRQVAFLGLHSFQFQFIII